MPSVYIAEDLDSKVRKYKVGYWSGSEEKLRSRYGTHHPNYKIHLIIKTEKAKYVEDTFFDIFAIHRIPHRNGSPSEWVTGVSLLKIQSYLLAIANGNPVEEHQETIVIDADQTYEDIPVPKDIKLTLDDGQELVLNYYPVKSLIEAEKIVGAKDITTEEYTVLKHIDNLTKEEIRQLLKYEFKVIYHTETLTPDYLPFMNYEHVEIYQNLQVVLNEKSLAEEMSKLKKAEKYSRAVSRCVAWRVISDIFGYPWTLGTTVEDKDFEKASLKTKKWLSENEVFLDLLGVKSDGLMELSVSNYIEIIRPLLKEVLGLTIVKVTGKPERKLNTFIKWGPIN